VCFIVCRVLSIGHTAKSHFAVCHNKNTWLKKNTWQINTLPCAFFGTRQNHALPYAFSLPHGKVNSLPCAKEKHSAKHGFAVCFTLHTAK